ncbi:hypothetical protein [Demequina sp.]|uniref:hypothetical protein n=1 Tax=Demequina sp. TaxID=2050685 RepID=UPI0025F4CC65|nr:hypothetical protein [Demequina sp.]
MANNEGLTPASEEKGGMGRTRKARWLGIVLVLAVGGAAAAWAASQPDSGIGKVIAYGLLGIILLLVLSRFMPDSWFGGRVGRNRARGR